MSAPSAAQISRNQCTPAARHRKRVSWWMVDAQPKGGVSITHELAHSNAESSHEIVLSSSAELVAKMWRSKLMSRIACLILLTGEIDCLCLLASARVLYFAKLPHTPCHLKQEQVQAKSATGSQSTYAPKNAHSTFKTHGFITFRAIGFVTMHPSKWPSTDSISCSLKTSQLWMLRSIKDPHRPAQVMLGQAISTLA